MLSNTYFLAKFCFDTAENEPAKNLQNFAEDANFANEDLVHAPRVHELRVPPRLRELRELRVHLPPEVGAVALQRRHLSVFANVRQYNYRKHYVI